MAKKGKKKAAAPAQVATNEQPLAHNPFGALAGLGGAAPGPTTSPPAKVAEATRAPASVNPITQAQHLIVRIEKKGRRGKTVTRIQGLPTHALDEVAGDMKKALGCGAIVEEGHVLLLGSLEDRAARWLEARGARRVTRGTRS